MNEITLLAKSGLGWQGIGGIFFCSQALDLSISVSKLCRAIAFFQSRNIISPRRITTNQLRQRPCRKSRPQCLISTAARTEFLPSGKSAIPLTARNIPR